MYTIAPHADGKMIVLTFSGVFDLKQGKALCKELKHVIGQFPPDLTLLTDLTHLVRVENDAYACIDTVMEMFNAHGTKKLLRLIRAEGYDFGFSIMSQFHYSHGVIMHTFTSRRDLDAYLGIHGTCAHDAVTQMQSHARHVYGHDAVRRG